MKERVGSSVFEYDVTSPPGMVGGAVAATLIVLLVGALLVWSVNRANMVPLIWAAGFGVGAIAVARMIRWSKLRLRPLSVGADGVALLAQDRSVVTHIRWHEVKKFEQRRYFSLLSFGPKFVVKVAGANGRRVVFRSTITGAQVVVAELNRKIESLDIPVTFSGGRFRAARIVSQLTDAP